MTSTIIDRTGSSSSSATVERQTGLVSSAAVKGPCRSYATTAITLSGEQTVAGVALVTGDRVLVGGQADATANGIYIVSTGAWQRSPDFNRNDDVVTGSIVSVTSGSNAGLWVAAPSASPMTVGTDTVTFSSYAAALNSELIDTDGTLAANSDVKVASQKATRTYVTAAIDAIKNGVSSAFDTLSEIATALGLKANAADAALTGVPTAPTAIAGTSTTQIATTAFVAAGFQALKTILTTLGNLADGAGYLLNDGAGGLSWASVNSLSALTSVVSNTLGSSTSTVTLTVGATYKDLELFVAFDHTAGSNQQMNLSISTDNGVSYSTVKAALSAAGLASGTLVFHRVIITNAGVTGNKSIIIHSNSQSANGNDLMQYTETSKTGVITHIKVVSSSGNVASGSKFFLYGRT